MSVAESQGAMVPARGERGATGAVVMQAPSPGTYWRLRRKTKARHDDRIQCGPMEKGTVLMLASIEHADGQPHVYNFAAHPNLPKGERGDERFHADDFYTWWEPAPDGEAVRARELHQLLLEMDQTKQQMLQPPPDAVPAALLAHDPAAAVGEPGQALVTTGQLEAMLQRAEQLKEDATRRSKWIEKHSTTLAEQGTVLANFHQERAQAALARAAAQMEGVEGILKTVANLRLYTGEGVELLLLRDGAPAAPEEPITFYQDVLSLDEESLILLDQGGLDHTQADSLVRALEDPALLQRLIPAPRGATLVRFRNSYKEFAQARPDAEAATKEAVARFNSQQSRESMRKRLLVRDGDRLWLIDANEVLEPIKQLMPSSAEQDEYFYRRHSWNEPAERITREHIGYAKAQRRQMFALDHYGKVLIMLWGLHDRSDLFEGAQIPKFTNWLDPAFQNAHLRLLSLDTLLGQQRPSFSAWQAEHNAFLASGALVAVNLGAAFTQVRAPGAFTQGRWTGRDTYYEEIYTPTIEGGRQAVLIARVRSDTRGLYVDVPCRYSGYGRNVRRQTAVIKLYLRYAGPHDRLVEGVLVLDRVHAADLSYYLESREQRRSYASYVKLFRAAREWVAQRDAGERPLREQLRAAAMAGQIPMDPDRIEAALTAAIAVARAARRDGQVPRTGSPAFAAFLVAAMDALHAGLVDNGGHVYALERWAADANRQLLRLVRTGRGDWKLYLVPTDSEHDARLGAPVHATVAKVAFTKDGSAQVDVTGRALLRALAREQVVHDWERQVPAVPGQRSIAFPDDDDAPLMVEAGAAAWLAKAAPYRMSYADAIATLDLPIAHSSALETLSLPDLVRQAVHYMRHASKSVVRRMPIQLAIGTALRSGEPVLLLAQIDALAYAHTHGDAEMRAACIKEIRSIYVNPGSHVISLEKGPATWSLQWATLDHVARLRNQPAPWCKQQVRSRYADRSSCGRPGSKKLKSNHELAVMTLSPLGAKLLPWLCDYTRGAVG